MKHFQSPGFRGTLCVAADDRKPHLTAGPEIKPMRMTRIDRILLPVLVGILATVAYVVFSLVGFLGLGILGLVIGVMAQRIEIEKDGAVSNYMTTSLYAQQFKAREGMSRAEKAEHAARSRTLLKWLFVAKVVSAGLIILGFGFFLISARVTEPDAASARQRLRTRR
jgi:hypothetical protein